MLMHPTRALVAIALAAAPLAAQSIEQRVKAVGDGSVQLRYAAHAGVCGDGRSYISPGRNSYIGEFHGSLNGSDWRANCAPGPVRVVLSVRGGEVDNVRAYVGPDRDQRSDVTDLGTVPSRAASDYLLSLARTALGRVGEKAILPAILADSAAPWPALFAIARDSASRPRATRDAAYFWLGRAAAAKVNGGDIFTSDGDDDDDQTDVAGSAVFALSQLHHREGIEPLLEVARSNKNPKVRSKALFWLGQSHDPRALTLFSEILDR
ncbi:MAG: HEAT repeat domain-containing protein [Gemmatimonadaceae bacterium]